jgi:probable F420-dependent oxidoreductase
MKIGIQWFTSDESIRPERLAREVEERGFASLMITEHTHLPVADMEMPDAYGGGPVPEFYKRFLDPFVTLSFAAAATTTLEVGTAVCLVAQRDAVVTAKEVATLDLLSGGRFIFGVGFGWNPAEAVAHRLDWKKRFSIVREKVALMKELWTSEVAQYDGQFVELPPSWAWPKPVQRPHPPVYLGGGGPLTMRHAAEWADCWFPPPRPDDPTMARTIPKFREAVEKAGRDPQAVAVAIATAPADVKVLESFRDLGVEHTTLMLFPSGEDDTLRELDAFCAVRDAIA